MRALAISTMFMFVISLAPSCQPKAATKSETATSTLRDVELTEFKELMAAPNTVILDVRTPEETAEGVIPGAIQIDYRGDNFKEEVAKLDKSMTYLVYCKSGGRSSMSCDVMKDLGFESLINLNGGYTAWQEAQ